MVNLDDVSEVLRETLHLKKEEGAIEVQLKAHNKAYVFHPQHVDDTFDAIVRSRQQHASARALRDEQGESHPHARAEAGFTADPHAAHTAPDSAQALQALLEKATLERYKPGDTIIAANSRPCTLFNIAKGRVAVDRVVGRDRGRGLVGDQLVPTTTRRQHHRRRATKKDQ